MKNPFLKFYVGDYLADTMHLSTEEHGAYMLLLMNCWQHGKIKNDVNFLKSVLKVSPQKCKKLMSIIGEFFIEKDGYLYNERLEQERAEAAEKYERRVNAGRKGGLAKSQNNPSNATAKPKQSQSKATAKLKQPEPEPDNKKINTKKDGFEEFWDLVPDKVKIAKAKCRKEFKAAIEDGATDKQIINGYRCYLNAMKSQEWRDFCHPLRWLEEERWNAEDADNVVDFKAVAGRASPPPKRTLSFLPDWAFESWENIRQTLCDDLSAKDKTFIEPLECLNASDEEITLVAPSKFLAGQAREKFGAQLTKAWQSVKADVKVKIVQGGAHAQAKERREKQAVAVGC